MRFEGGEAFRKAVLLHKLLHLSVRSIYIPSPYIYTNMYMCTCKYILHT